MAYGFTAQTNNGSSASGTSITVNFTVGASDTLIVAWVAYSGIVSTTSLSDGTHTYNNSAGGSTVASTLTHRIGSFYVLAPTPGTYTLTVTLGGSRANRRVAVATYSGISAFQTALSQGQLAAATSTDAVSTSLMTPTTQPALLTAMSFTASGTATYTQGTGFTSRSSLANWDSIGSFSSLMEDMELTSTSNVAGTFTIGTSKDTLSSGLIFTETATTANVAPSGIASTAAFGTASVGPTYPVSATGIPSGAVFGTATVTHIHALTSSGIASTTAFGTPTITVDGASGNFTGVSGDTLNFGPGVSGAGVSIYTGVVKYFTN